MPDTGYTLAILAVAYAVVHAAPLATTLTVATLNVRTKSRNESTLNPAELPWDLRKGAMIQSILDEQPDVIAFQEPREEQVKDLEEGLAPKYSCISILVWEGGDMLATCWNTETTESHLQSHFWLSETPDTPYSKGWDATFARAALMANFKLKSMNELFWAVNTHLDAAGAKAREEEAKLIISRLRPLIRGDTGLGAPPESLIFLLGDFNAVRDTPAYTILTGSRYNLEEGASPEPDTFRDQRRDFGSDQDTPTSDSFGTPKDPKSIDYIMNAVNNGLAKHWSVDAVDILNNEMTHEGKTYIYSDHSTTTPSDPTIDEPTPDTPIPDGPSPHDPVPNNEAVSRAMKTMRLGIKQE